MDKLPAMVTDLDDVDEALQKFYKKTSGGSYLLAVQEVGGVELTNPSKLDKSLKEARRERDEAKSALEAFTDEDGNLLDVDAARGALKALAENTPEDVEKRIREARETGQKKAREEFQRDLAKIQAERDALLHENDSGRVEKALLDALMNTEDGRTKPAGSPKPLMSVLAPQVKVFREDGGPEVRVVDSSGRPREHATGGAYSVTDLVDELRGDADYKAYWEAPVKKGTMPPDNGRRRTVNPGDAATISKVADPAERIRMAREAGIRE